MITKLNFRVILIENEDYKIKYELFCVYCERFSGVRYSIKESYFDRLMFFSYSAAYSNQLSARLLCHPGDFILWQDKKNWVQFFGFSLFCWSDSCGALLMELSGGVTMVGPIHVITMAGHTCKVNYFLIIFNTDAK